MIALRWEVRSTSIMCTIWDFYWEVIFILQNTQNLAVSGCYLQNWLIYLQNDDFEMESLFYFHYVRNMELLLRSDNHFASYSKFGWFWTLPTEKLVDNVWLIIAQWPNFWLSIVSLFCGYKLSLLTRQAVIFDPQHRPITLLINN